MRCLRRCSSCTRIVVLLFLCALSAALQKHYDFQHDDAYISYRYAAHWARGDGPVYNVGERVEGYSNFLLVAFLTTVARLGFDIVSVSRTLGSLSVFVTIVLVFVLLRRILTRSEVLALSGAAALGLHAGLAVWARSGLETLPATMVLLLAQWCFLREQIRGASPGVSAVLFGIIALLRADGFLFALPSLIFLLGVQRAPKRALRFGAILLLFVLPHFIWRLQYYGFPFPNSYYLKTGGDFFQQLRGLHYTYNFVLPFGGVLLFALPLCLVWCRDARRDGPRLYLGLHGLLIGVYVVWVGGDHMPMGRFYMPLVPALTILVLEAIVEIGRRLQGLARGARLRTVSLLLAVVVTAGLLPALNSRRVPSSHAVSCRVFVEQCILAGKWFRSHEPPGTLLATAPAGAVAYHSDLPIVDMLGVNDVHIAHLQVPDMGHGSAGHEKRDLDYVLSCKPQIIFRGVADRCDGPGTRPGAVRTYADGSRYLLRCEPLGPGPYADDYGNVRRVELFLKYEVRESTADPWTGTRSP